MTKKRKSISPGLGGNTQKLNDVTDGKFPNDLDYASIFSKVISHKLSDNYTNDLYLQYRMNFAVDFVQTQTPYLMDMGILVINTLNKAVSLVLLLTGFEVQRMDPIGVRRIVFLVKRQRLELVRQSQTMTIAIKLIMKFGGQIRNLSAKIFQ